MINKVIACKNIYPDIEEDTLDKLREFKEKYGIGINFLFEDGIEFEYNTELYLPVKSFGDVSFLDPNSRNIVFSVVDLFDEVVIYSGDRDKIYLKIPILD